jgi:hypothetical protein
MKKLLLIAALAAVAFGANAEGYKLEKVWELNTSTILTTADVRQGFGMDGKFYINDKGTQAIYILDENGLANEQLPGGANCGITRDEAGNIVISNATFPGAWGPEATIKVINPNTLEEKEYVVPEECGLLGRCDFLGFAKGNFFEDGVLYLTGGNTGTDPYTDGVAIFTVTGGEVDFDNCYTATVDPAVVGQTSTVINYYKDLNGDDALVYAYRSGYPSKLMADGDNFVKTTLELPAFGEYGKGHCNGAFPFIWDGKELIIYPLMPDYLDGWAIAEAGAVEPIVGFAATATANPTAYQANWLNAEVNEDGSVTIYQYMPGLCIRVFKLTKDEPAPEPAKVYMLGGDDQGWDPTTGTEFAFDAENNVYTATINFPAEYNWFGFTTELAENNDDGGWAYIEPFRFGAVADGDYWYTGEEDFISLTWDEYHAIRIAGGEYNLTVSLEDMKLMIEKVLPDFVRGDVDGDNNVNITDVTTLIDMLLTGADMVPAADCDLDNKMSIADVTTLIDFLLSGNWPE